MTTLGEALKILRGDMSLREARERIGISHTYLDRLEKGIDPRTGKEISPSVSVLRTIADAYNVPVELMLVVAGYLDDESIDPDLRNAMKEIDGQFDRDAILQVALQMQAIARGKASKNEDVEAFLSDSDSLTPEELFNKYALRVDGELVSKEEWEEAFAFIRARRMMRNKSSSSENV